jgi:hypothetical protein
MDTTQQVREFLMSRRAKVTPEQVGLPRGGGHRRVEGLRREEVAILAGVSIEYYAQIERGDISRASDEILHAIAGALRLDDVERDHLFDLARAAGPRNRRPAPPKIVHPNLQRMMDAMAALPATVQNGRLDLVATNQLGRAVYSAVLEHHQGQGMPNLAKYLFLDERSRETFPDWDAVADDAVATLQAESARAPQVKAHFELIGELSTLSTSFRAKWATHNVSAHRRGTKRVRHAQVGEMSLQYESLEVSGAPGLQLVTFLAEPGSPSEDALRLLGSLTVPTAQMPLPEAGAMRVADGASADHDDRRL